MATKREIRTVLSLSGEQEYTRSMNNIQDTLGLVNTEQKLLNSQYEAGDKSLAKLTQQQDILTRRLEAQRSKVKLINKAYQESAAKGEDAAEATIALERDLNMAQAAVNRTERELRHLNAEMDNAGSKSKQYAARLKELGITADSVGGAMQRVGDKVAAVSMGFAVGVTGYAVKGWMSLEDEMANVATIADTSAKSMDDLTTEVLQVSDATGFAATEIAAAEYQAISAGVATADAAELVEKAGKAAKAGMSDVTTVIEGSTSIINAWGISAADTESVFDKLLKTQQRGKTTIGELAAGIGQVTGLAPQLGITLDEVLASVATLTLSGVSASTAMTGLKGVMSAIIKPTAEAREEAARLGIQFDAAAVEAMGFTEFLAMVMEATGGDAESLAKLFGSVDALSQIMLLGGASAETYADILNDLGNSAGTLDTMFDARTSSAAERFSAALNRINNAAISFGQSLAPMIDVAAGAIENFAEKLSGMSAEEAQNIVSTALWIAGVSKGISVMGGMVKNLSALKKGFSSVSALLSASGPVVAGIAVTAAAVAGLAYAMDSVTAKSTLDVDVDESELRDYHIDDFTYGEEITITANAKIQVNADLVEWGGSAVEWLTDGKAETQQELDQYMADLDGIIDVGFTAITTNYERRKEDLNALLDEGLIDPKTHARQLRALDEQTDDMAEMLETDSNTVTEFVRNIYAENRAMTDAEIEELDRLLLKLGETTGYILDATDASRQAYEWAYRKTLAGVGTKTDKALAVEYIELDYRLNVDDLDKRRAEVSAKYANALSVGGLTDADIAMLAEAEQAELAELDAELKTLNEERDARYRELIDLELEALGVDPETVKLINEAKAAGYDKWYSALYPLGYSSYEDVAMGEKYSNVLEKYEDLDFTPVDNLVNSWAANGPAAADGITEVTDAFGMLYDTTEQLEDLPEDFEEIGEQAMDGFTRGMGSKYDEVMAAAAGAAKAATESARHALAIHSPSREFEEIGELSMDGLIVGVNNRLAAVQQAYAAAVRPDVSAVTAGTSGASASTMRNSGNTYNINYTAGAGTRREARMLSQRLAAAQRAANIAEGL